MNSAASWRKAILLNRSALLSAWPQHFPRHDFHTLRLIRSPLDWDDEAWAKFKERFGHFPPWDYRSLQPEAPSESTLRWVKSRQIAYAKSGAVA